MSDPTVGPNTKHSAGATFFWDPRGLGDPLVHGAIMGHADRPLPLWLRMVGDHPSRGMWEFTGVVRIPGQARRIAIYWAQSHNVPYYFPEKGPRLTNAGFRGAKRKGAQAALDGADKVRDDPYIDWRTDRGGVTYSRAWSRYWDDGYEAGKGLFAVFVGERLGITRAPGEEFENLRARIDALFPGHEGVPSDASATLAASPTKE